MDSFLAARAANPLRQRPRVQMPSDRTAATPWYAAGTAPPPPLTAVRANASSSGGGPVKTIRKNAAARKKYYTSDSSGSEAEGVIRRMPRGSSKEFYVYYKGKKITFGVSGAHALAPIRADPAVALRRRRRTQTCQTGTTTTSDGKISWRGTRATRRRTRQRYTHSIIEPCIALVNAADARLFFVLAGRVLGL